LRKAIRSQRDRVGARDLLDNLGIAQKFEPRFQADPALGTPASLALNSMRRVRTEVAFAFQDVPVP